MTADSELGLGSGVGSGLGSGVGDTSGSGDNLAKLRTTFDQTH